MNNINNSKILSGFFNAVGAAEKVIKYNPQYMDHKLRVDRDIINFMNALTHPTLRIVLKVGEFAVTRATHPNPRFAKASNVLLLRGTQYGTLCLFGKEAEYKRNEKTGAVTGPIPQLHATSAFMMAADRFFKRRGIPFTLQGSEMILINWIFSDTFADDLAEQAKADLAAGIKLGDGMPPKPAYKKKPAPAGDKKPDLKAKEPANDAKFERRSKPRIKADPKVA